MPGGWCMMEGVNRADADTGMKHPPHPTFRELAAFLDALGFRYRVQTDGPYRYHRYEKDRRNIFLFRDYAPDDTVSGPDMFSVHTHLTWNGLIPDVPYFDFLAQFAPAKAG